LTFAKLLVVRPCPADVVGLSFIAPLHYISGLQIQGRKPANIVTKKGE
jgi:hypothetical protein